MFTRIHLHLEIYWYSVELTLYLKSRDMKIFLDEFQIF